MQVVRCGANLAHRVRSVVAEALGLKRGDETQLAGEHDFLRSHGPGREALLSRLRAFRGRLPGDFVFDRNEANEC